MPNMGNNVTYDRKDDPPGRLYMRMGRDGKTRLCGIFIEDVGGGIVAEFEIDFSFLGIFEAIEVGVQDTIAKSVGSWLAVIRSHRC